MYIQDDDSAEELLGWLIKKTMYPKINVGLNIFGLPTLQLGDIASIDYEVDGIKPITESDKLFTVYNIEYSKSSGESSMTVYLAEV
jgi:hypothetical protein